VLRVDYSGVAGSTFGVSAYYGKSGQADLHVHETTIADAHADVRIKGLYLRSVVSFANLTGADRLRNAGTGIGPADQMYGAYVEVGYDVLRFFETEQELYPHIRVEKIDTQYKVAAGNVLRRALRTGCADLWPGVQTDSPDNRQGRLFDLQQ
jgi:hypothetical protein